MAYPYRSNNSGVLAALIFVILLWLFIVIAGPMILIWAINTLGGLSIQYSAINWLAALAIMLLLKAQVSFSTKK